jgi:drug/metabolite transporter (DMT)-like permease
MDCTVFGGHHGDVNRRATLLFAGLSLAWGIPYLLIKVSVDEISPLALVLFRTGLGALLILPLALGRGVLRPVLARWRVVLLYTAVEISVPWWLLSHAEVHLSSSLAGLLIATVPLAGVAVGMLLRQHERLGLGGVVGLAHGLLGVAFLVGVDVGGTDLLAVGELVVVVICYAFGAALMGHQLGDLPGLGVVAASLVAASLAYLPIALAVPGSLPATLPSGKVVLSEPVTAATGVGFVLVLLGSALVTRRPRALAAELLPPDAAPIAGATILGPSTEAQPETFAGPQEPLSACGAAVAAD